MLDNDAIGCFNCIIQAHVLLAIQWMGAPKLMANTLWKTWTKTLHCTKTAHSLSTQTYGSTLDTPLFGAGQGSCAMPFFWGVIFSLISKVLDPLFTRIIFISVCGHLTQCRLRDAFADDISFRVVSSYENDPDIPQQTNPQLEELEAMDDLRKLTKAMSICFSQQVEH